MPFTIIISIIIIVIIIIVIIIIIIIIVIIIIIIIIINIVITIKTYIGDPLITKSFFSLQLKSKNESTESIYLLFT